MGMCRYIKIRILVRIVRRMLLPSQQIRPCQSLVECGEQRGEAALVPQVVKKGYFAVFAVKGETPKRFVIKLRYLSNPDFLKLLQQAEQEYGFQHEGALTVPCTPEDLQMILQ